MSSSTASTTPVHRAIIKSEKLECSEYAYVQLDVILVSLDTTVCAKQARGSGFIMHLFGSWGMLVLVVKLFAGLQVQTHQVVRN